MKNIFVSLGAWFTSGTEDFFTASLALFLERNETFREEFLNWLAPHVQQDDLHRHQWVVKAQVGRASCKGTAVIDMELGSPDLLLWFEHKIGTGKGKYGEIDQIEKYLDAANRVMLGVEDGASAVQWPTDGPNEECPRVALFYVTRDLKGLDRSRYEGRIYAPRARFGLVWPPQGHLRWRDFWNPAQRALDGALRGESGEFERTLSHQFLRYWRSLPGMWKHALPGKDWSELLPDSKDLPEGQSCGFNELWEEVKSIALQQLRCRSSIIGYLGYEQRLEFATDACPQVDQICVNAVRDVTSERNWDDRLGRYVLRLLLRRRDDQGWPPFRSEAVFEDHWPARLRLYRVRAAQQLEVLVGIRDWDNCRDTSERRAAVADAFWAGIKIAVSEVGVEFRGLNESPRDATSPHAT